MSSLYIAKAILAMVSCMVMGTVLPRQLPESPCHSSTQQPTFSPHFIWRGNLPIMWPSSPRWPTWMFSLYDCCREWLYNGWNCLFCRKPQMINVMDTHSYLELCLYACNCLVHIIWKFFSLLLTHCILNRLSHTIYWKSPITILGEFGYEIYIFLEKNG